MENQYTNLTKIRKSGANIDWDQLDGRNYLLVNGDQQIPGTLELNRKMVGILPSGAAAYAKCWVNYDQDRQWRGNFNKSWMGTNGWCIWVQGDVPTR